MVSMQYIIVSGNIGAGKSTLAGRLADRVGWSAFYEAESENPYLEDFYRDMGRWSFHSQLYFLTDRLRMFTKISQSDGILIQDRSMYEDAEIFARNLYMRGLMSQRDYATYQKTYNLLCSFIQPPELVVYLKSDLFTLKERIKSRGRACEYDIDDEYLLGLNALYEEWIGAYDFSSVLTIDTSRIDIVRRESDLNRVVELIRDAVKEKQEPLFEDY
jgi:deoxyadenosine/deoxycytidine kinase